jgi:hypothetical protein
MPKVLNALERRRTKLQAALDLGKTQSERNRLGQFATPPALAEDIVRYAKTLLAPGVPVHFLDPAFGTGAFYSAVLKVFPKRRVREAVGFEIDPYYAEPAAQVWADRVCVSEAGLLSQNEYRDNICGICREPGNGS